MFGLSSLTTTLIGAALLAIVSAAGGAYVVHRMDEATIQENRANALQAINDAWKAGWAQRTKQDAATSSSNKSNGAKQQQIANNGQEIIRYVPHYITVHDDAACVLPDGFGRLLDAAELGVSPDSLPAGAGQPGSATAPITLSQATGLLTQILTDYASLRARILNAHEDWQAQAAIATAPPAK